MTTLLASFFGISSMLHASVCPRSASRLIAISLLASLLPACSVGPDYVRPTISIPNNFEENGVSWHRTELMTSAAPVTTLPDECAQWWCLFGDDQLNRYELLAVRSNQSLAEAQANYRRSRAVIAEAKSTLFPTLGLTAGAQRSKVANALEKGNRFDYYQITDLHTFIEARWEPDVWGQVRRTIESASASSQSSAAIAAGVRQSLTSALANAYFDLRVMDLDLRALRRERQINGCIATMTHSAMDQGLANADDVLRAQNAVDTVDSLISDDNTIRARDEHAIAAIINVTPEDLLIRPIPDYQLPTPFVQPGVPSALLERRPDIVEAEREVASANAQIGIAQAAFFPDLTVGGYIGGENSALAGLLAAPARVWSLGPSLALSMFDAGRHSAQLDQARAQYDATAARYRFTVITAFRDVEDALVSERDADRATQNFTHILKRSKKIFDHEELQVNLGLAGQTDLAQAEIIYLEAKRHWQSDSAVSTQSRVALIKAIGGGWQRDEAEIARTEPTQPSSNRSR